MLLLALSLSLFTGCGIPSAAGTSGEETEAEAAGETETASFGKSALEGQWKDETDNGITLDIWWSDDGLYHGRIIKPVADVVVTYYEFTAAPEKNSLSYTDGVRTDITYNEDWEAKEDVVYSDGSGTLSLEGDAVIWTEKKEDLGTGLRFIR